MSAFTCDICGMEFKLKYEIIVHLKEHRTVKQVHRNSNTGILCSTRID